MFRWDYDYVEVGDAAEEYAYGLTELDDPFRQRHLDDEWSLGSTSSYSAGSRSPPADMRSSIEAEEASWEGETLGSTSDAEKR